jgi:hypothetical protein
MNHTHNWDESKRYFGLESLNQKLRVDTYSWLSELCICTYPDRIGPSVRFFFSHIHACWGWTYLQRGVGDLAVGCSVSLISSAEDKFYKALTKKTGICLDKLNLDSRILAVAQERVNLASKIAGVADEDRKRHRDNQWFIDHAAEAGLEIDDDLLDNGEQMDKRQQAKRSGMDTAKQQLRTMLSEPMRVQRFGKFLSTNLSATQSTVPEATPLPPQPMTKKRRKRK